MCQNNGSMNKRKQKKKKKDEELSTLVLISFIRTQRERNEVEGITNLMSSVIFSMTITHFE